MNEELFRGYLYEIQVVKNNRIDFFSGFRFYRSGCESVALEKHNHPFNSDLYYCLVDAKNKGNKGLVDTLAQDYLEGVKNEL